MPARAPAATIHRMALPPSNPNPPGAAWRIPGLVLLVAIAVGGFVVAASARDVHVTQHAATYPRALRLELDSGSGPIRIHGEERADIAIASRIRSTGRSPELETDASAARLRVRASCHHRFFDWDLGNDSFGVGPVCSTSYTAAMPAATSLAVDLGQGDVRADGLTSRTVVVHSGTGDVDLDFRAAPRSLQVDSGTGDVLVHVPAGRYAIELNSGIGDKHVDQGIVSDPLSSNVIQIDSGTGDVSLERSDV
jgi:DUF4097 and DUF4098 domain-containing protein YvlB